MKTIAAHGPRKCRGAQFRRYCSTRRYRAGGGPLYSGRQWFWQSSQYPTGTVFSARRGPILGFATMRSLYALFLTEAHLSSSPFLSDTHHTATASSFL